MTMIIIINKMKLSNELLKERGNLSDLSDSFERATAVIRGQNQDYFLAVSDGIMYIRQDGTCLKVCTEKVKILDLTCNGDVIAGVGHGGVFLISLDYGLTWSRKELPTNVSVWSISMNSLHTIFTHGHSQIFLSNDYGDSWIVYSPFSAYGNNQPSIRSICIDKKYLYVGTKVHHQYGGIWCIDIEKHALKRLKYDTRMIASILKINNTLICAIGTCKNDKGSIEYVSLSNSTSTPLEWILCHDDAKRSCYLDLSENNGYIYATTTQDNAGISQVSRIFLNEQKMTPCAKIHGHGWRISNLESNFLVAGLHASLMSSSDLILNTH
ncbi:WD40/YVTN/BNR-like repeat-containing protein [Salipaludibacillus sp. HK11]|uniref:WD40/YVTN/BNR-like repeat-containing protein n=1 Tax=Salipaludibacillus sp. HK11 TaxID=3394320 RepID=UPI0039FD6F71